MKKGKILPSCNTSDQPNLFTRRHVPFTCCHLEGSCRKTVGCHGNICGGCRFHGNIRWGCRCHGNLRSCRRARQGLGPLLETPSCIISFLFVIVILKICTVTYQGLSSKQPAYLYSLLTHARKPRQLRSSSFNLLFVPRVETNIRTIYGFLSCRTNSLEFTLY